jgi:hypothetical protein
LGKKYARNILYLIPSKDWTTKERLAFKDMQISKEYGYNVYIVTPPDSFLAKECTEAGIEILPIPNHFFNRFTNFHKYLSLKKYSNAFSIDIVHCYDFNILFSLSFQLRRFNLNSRVVTQDHAIDKPLQRFWYKPLISRIDFLILCNKILHADVIGNLGIPEKKIEYFGMGVRHLSPKKPDEIEVNFQVYQDYFLTGIFISPEIDTLLEIEPVLLALKYINQAPPSGSEAKLVLVCPVAFTKLSIFPELKQKIEELEIEEQLLFVSTQDIEGIMTKLSLWVSASPKELVQDYTYAALFQDVPVVMVRNFSTVELLRDYEGVGETYKALDSRELREKWSKIMMAHSVYRDKVRLFKYFIEREHNFKKYRNELIGLYGKMAQRRLRVFRKK